MAVVPLVSLTETRKYIETAGDALFPGYRYLTHDDVAAVVLLLSALGVFGPDGRFAQNAKVPLPVVDTIKALCARRTPPVNWAHEAAEYVRRQAVATGKTVTHQFVTDWANVILWCKALGPPDATGKRHLRPEWLGLAAYIQAAARLRGT